MNPFGNKSAGKIQELKYLPERCDFCGCCVAVCPVDCIDLEEFQLTVNRQICTLCGNCPKACPVAALEGVLA
jgi:pyruvate formate lyase activating enzyme